jgi:undecaprenyl-diphosphatase
MRTPIADRATLGFGLLALLGFAVLTSQLGALQWYDTYVAAVLDQWRGCDLGDRTAWFGHMTPFVGTGFVMLGVLVALARGARVPDVVCDLLLLAAGLLFAQGMKLVLLRDRPGLPPWSMARDSYPSGHVCNIAICVAIAVRLCRRRGDETNRVQLGVALAGVATILTVAFTRLYLRRHWLTDVTGSALVAVAFVCLASTPLIQRRTWRLAALVLVLASTVGTAIRAGWYIRLPSPATFEDTFAANYLPRAEISGVELTQAPDELLFEELDEHRLHFTFDSRDEGRGVLKLLAQPVARFGAHRCSWIALRVDGVLMPVRSLSARWRTYSFPMPELAPGHHTIDLAVVRTPARHAAAHQQPTAVRAAFLDRAHGRPAPAGPGRRRRPAGAAVGVRRAP